MCYRVYESKAGGERVSDTIDFFPQNMPMPGKSSTERAIVAAEELSDALKHSHFSAPVNKIGNITLEALNKLSTIFNAATENTMEPTKDVTPQ